MATRLYLPWAGTAPILPPYDTAWEENQASAQWPTSTTKSDNALANKTFGNALSLDTSTHQQSFGQWVSPALDINQTITGTVSMVIRGLENQSTADGHLAFSLRVITPALTVRGTLLLFHATSTEFVLTAETRIHSARALSSVAGLAGDYIVMEIGTHLVTPAASSTVTMRFGDPTAVADFALTSGLTTDLDPWFELSQTITFAVLPPQAIRQARQSVKRAAFYAPDWKQSPSGLYMRAT